MTFDRPVSCSKAKASMSALLLLLFGFLWPALFPQANRLAAQKAIGVHWKVPESNQEAFKQLEAFHNWGIRYLNVDTKLRASLLELTDSLDYRVFVSIPNKYTTEYQLLSRSSTIIEALRDYGQYYEDEEHIQAFGLFHYAQFEKHVFREQTRPLVQDFKDLFGKPVYYTSARPGLQDTLQPYDFFIYRSDRLGTLDLYSANTSSMGGALISPPLEQYSLREFQNLMQSSVLGQSTPVFLESTWLLAQANSHPDLASVIRTFTTQKEPLLSTPSPTQEPEEPQWLVLVLIGLWASFAIHYAVAPTYRKSLFRYFTVHRFFVNDILERRLRSVAPGVIILLQQILMGGIFFYLLTSGLFSNHGLEAIYWHFPFLAYMGKSRFVFFVAGILFMIITQLIYLLWLYFLNKDIKFFNQVVILYSWPHQFNLLTVTLMVTFFLSENIGTAFYIFSGLFALIWLVSFYVAAGDLSHQIRYNRMLYITHTTGLHTIILILLFIFLYSFSGVPDILRLATTLP